LGCATLFYLVAAGVACSDEGNKNDGKILLIENDKIEISNLQRQILYNELEIGLAKVDVAVNKLKLLNTNLNIEGKNSFADYNFLVENAQDCNIIIDASDNFDTRYAANLFCHNFGKTLFFAAVKGFSGQFMIFESFKTENPCYCCFNHAILQKNPPLPIEEKAILGGVAGSLGTMLSVQVIKEILGLNLPDSRQKMIIMNFLNNNFRNVKIGKNPACKICF